VTVTEPGGAPPGAPQRSRGFGPVLHVAVAVSLLILLSLGTWQLQRLAWKSEILTRIAALEASPARPLEATLRRADAGEDVEFARVRTACADFSPRIVHLYALREGQAGWRPIVACGLEDESHGSILVDLGFRPGEPGEVPSPQVLSLVPGEPIVGVLRRATEPVWFERLAPRPPSPDGARWLRRDLPGMAAALGATDPAPLMLMLESPSGGPGLTQAAVPTGVSNRHLEYAVTWYGLALALAAVYIAKLLRDRKA